MRRLATPRLGKITRRSLEAAAADVPQVALPVRIASPAALAAGLLGSIALLPVAWAQGRATRRRVPCLPPAKAPHHGVVPGIGEPVRLVAIGESPVAGIGLSRSDETVAAATARALGRVTGKPIVWRAHGLSGATVRDAMERVLPRVAPERADLLIVAFGVNDATAYRSPARYADDLAALVTAARSRVGDAAVVIGGVASTLLVSRAAVAAAQHSGLAVGGAAGGGRSADGSADAARGGALLDAARARPVCIRRIPPQP